MYRLLILLALIILTVVATFLYQPTKRFIAYNLHISGDNTTSCCEINDILNSSGKFDEEANVAIFNNQIIDYPKTSLAQVQTPQSESNLQILGTKNEVGEEKWIEVSLDDQKLRAWEGNRIVLEFSISSGRWYPTPKGDYGIWYKTRSQSMRGGFKELGTYYNLPNVPYNMFFYKGFAVHGTYWHNNFGHPMSHGCVNAPIPQAGWLFDWTGPAVPPGQGYVRATSDNPGTRVFVH